jgi:hypothetical protein
MIKDHEGKCYAVPTTWQINNVYFPRNRWHWFIKPELSAPYSHLVDSFFSRAGRNEKK